MGLFKANQPETKTLSEVFPPGTPFRLLGGQILGSAESTFGPQLAAKIWATPVTEPETPPLEFGVWGSLAEQLTAVEDGELPAIVTLSNASGVWTFSPHGPEPIEVEQPDGTTVSQPQRVDVTKHLDLDGGASDSALGAVSDRSAPPAPPVEEGGHGNPVPQEPPKVKPTPIDDSQTFQPGQG